MINFYSGTPGSGKSLHLARDITHYLNRNKDCLVVCNFAVDTSNFTHPERYLEIDYAALCGSPAFLVSLAKDWFLRTGNPVEEGRIILVIDEAQLVFNSRDWNTPTRRQWLSFFSQHRKFGYTVFLCAQFDLMLDKQIRNLIEYEYVHRKITNFGVIGLFVRLFALGEIFVVIERWYGINQKTSHSFFRARRKYYQIYDTFKDFGEWPEWAESKLLENENDNKQLLLTTG